MCTDEDCPAHGELIRLRRENEEGEAALRQARQDIIEIFALWALWENQRAFHLGSPRCHQCGYRLNDMGECPWGPHQEGLVIDP